MKDHDTACGSTPGISNDAATRCSACQGLPERAKRDPCATSRATMLVQEIAELAAALRTGLQGLQSGFHQCRRKCAGTQVEIEKYEAGGKGDEEAVLPERDRSGKRGVVLQPPPLQRSDNGFQQQKRRDTLPIKKFGKRLSTCTHDKKRKNDRRLYDG